MKLTGDIILMLDRSRQGFQKLKFEELYNSIDECINELINTSDKVIRKNLKGYEFLLSFKNQLLSGKTLSEKQIVQIKRLAPEIARGYYIENKFKQ